MSLPTTVVIPAGMDSISLQVTPIEESAIHGLLTVVASIATDPSYDIDPINPLATVYLYDDKVPVVSVVATMPTAQVLNLQPAAVNFTRTGGTSADLVVSYAVAGAASAGLSYVPLPGTVTIPAGQASAAVAITPLDDGSVDPPLDVLLTPSAGIGYQPDLAGADVTILSDHLPAPVVQYFTVKTGGGDIFGLVPSMLLIDGMTASVQAAVSGDSATATILPDGTFDVHVIAATSDTAVTVLMGYTAGPVIGPTAALTLRLPAGTGSGSGTTTGGDPVQIPPQAPTVTVLGIADPTGDFTGKWGSDQLVYFTKNQTVAVQVLATTALGDITNVTVIGSNGQTATASGPGTITLSVPEEGRVEISAQATATYQGQTATGTSSNTVVVVVDRTPPTVSFTVPARGASLSDADIVFLNNQSDTQNTALRSDRGANFYALSSFIASAGVQDLSGVSLAGNSGRAIGDCSATLTVTPTDPADNTQPQTLTMSGFGSLQDSVEYNPLDFSVSYYRGRYTAQLTLTDRAGNQSVNSSVFNLWVKTKPPMAKVGIIPYQFGTPIETSNFGLFKYADDGWSETNPGRYIVTTPDTMVAWVSSPTNPMQAGQTPVDPTQVAPTQVMLRLVTSNAGLTTGMSGALPAWLMYNGIDLPIEGSASQSFGIMDNAGNVAQGVNLTWNRLYVGQTPPPTGTQTTNPTFTPEQGIYRMIGNRPDDKLVWLLDDETKVEKSLLASAGNRQVTTTQQDGGTQIEVTDWTFPGSGDMVHVNPIDRGFDENAHSGPAVINIPPSWDTQRTVQVQVQENGIAQVLQKAKTGTLKIGSRVNGYDAAVPDMGELAIGTAGGSAITAQVPLDRELDMPGLARVNYKPESDPNYDWAHSPPPSTYLAGGCYTCVTGFRWMNLISASPDVTVTGTSATIAITAGFIDSANTLESITNALSQGSGNAVHFLLGESDVTVPYSATSSVDPDQSQYQNKIIITGIRMQADGANATIAQTLLVDVQIGTNVTAGLYNIDVNCGAVHEYTDALSEANAGANGAHRMLQALNVILSRVDYFTRDDDGTVRKVTAPEAIGDSKPDVAISSMTGTVQSDGTVLVNISGNIVDRLSEYISSDSEAMQQLTVYIDDAEAGTIALNYGSGDGIWTRRSLTKNFSTSVVYKNPIDGFCKIRVEGTNGAGNTGSDTWELPIIYVRADSVSPLYSDGGAGGYFLQKVDAQHVSFGYLGTSPQILGQLVLNAGTSYTYSATVSGIEASGNSTVTLRTGQRADLWGETAAASLIITYSNGSTHIFNGNWSSDPNQRYTLPGGLAAARRCISKS